MKRRIVGLLLASFMAAGCGLTGGQKSQVAAFAAATNVAVDIGAQQLIDVRSQVIEIRKEQLFLKGLQAPGQIDLEGPLKAEKLEQQIAAMRLLQDYGNALDALANSDQSAAIGKAVSHLAASAETASRKFAKPGQAPQLTAGQKQAAEGIAATLGGMYVENQKKQAINNLVKEYTPLVEAMAHAINQDLALIGNSPCWPAFRSGASSGATPLNNKQVSGTLDIFCTQADKLREQSLDILRCPIKNAPGKIPELCAQATPALRERAFTDYLNMNHAMDDVAAFSLEGEKLVGNLLAANGNLAKILEDDRQSAEDIAGYAVAIQRLATLVEVLSGKHRE